MKKKNVLIAIVVTLSALFLIGGVAACKRGFHHGGFDEFDLSAATDRIASRLDLTESQKADLEKIAQEIAEKAKTMCADRETCRLELADLVRQESIDEKVVDQMITDKMAKMRELANFSAEQLIAFHATLTPEQREEIATRIEEHSSGGCRIGMR